MDFKNYQEFLNKKSFDDVVSGKAEPPYLQIQD